MRTLKLGSLIPLAVITVILAACSGASATPAHTETVVEVARGTISITVSSAGNMSLKTKNDLRFGVAGTVTDVLVEPGDAVREGQALAKVDDASLKTALAQAKANAAAAQQNLDKLIQPSATDISVAEAEFTAADEAFTKAANLADADRAVADARATQTNALADREATALVQTKALDDALRGREKALDDYAFTLRKYYAIDPPRSGLIRPAGEIRTLYAPDPLIAFANSALIPYLPDSTTREQELEASFAAVRQTDSAYESMKVAQAKALVAADRAIATATDTLGTLEDDLLTLRSGKDTVNVAHARAARQRALEALDAVRGKPDAVLRAQREAALVAARQAEGDAGKAVASATLAAPYRGVVTGVRILKGDSITGAAIAVSLADPSSLQVSGLVDETDVLQLREGLVARVTLTALSQIQVPGTVDFVGITPTTQGGIVSYPVIITLQVPRTVQLREGLSVTSTIVIEEKADVVVVPVGAVQRDGRDRFVQVVKPDGTRERRTVTFGITDGQRIEVTAGLEPGEKVISIAASAAQTQFVRTGGGLGGGFGGVPGGGGPAPGGGDHR